MAHANAELVTRFYESFAKHDAEGMVACYADDVLFSDPVFPELRGDRAKGMWRMLCGRAKDLVIRFSDVTADDAKGGARWEADYTFAATGRKVKNVITASFVFRDGLIAEHHDVFGLWRWTRMALGPAGVLLGWSPIVQGKVRRQAGSALDAFLAK